MHKATVRMCCSPGQADGLSGQSSSPCGPDSCVKFAVHPLRQKALTSNSTNSLTSSPTRDPTATQPQRSISHNQQNVGYRRTSSGLLAFNLHKRVSVLGSERQREGRVESSYLELQYYLCDWFLFLGRGWKSASFTSALCLALSSSKRNCVSSSDQSLSGELEDRLRRQCGIQGCRLLGPLADTRFS